MAQIFSKACLLMLFLIIQFTFTTKTACADQSTLAISAAVLLGGGDPNSTQLAQLADKAFNANRIPIGSNGSAELSNPFRKRVKPLQEETNFKKLITNLLIKKLQAIQKQLDSTIQGIQPSFKRIGKLVQQKLEEAICEFCTNQIVLQLNSLNIRFESTLVKGWKQATASAHDSPRSIEASPGNPDSAKIDNVRLVILPAESCDNYWQYYQDCDRWGVTFSELEAANRKAYEVKIASKPAPVKTIRVGYRTRDKSNEIEQSEPSQNNFFRKHLSRLANDIVIETKKLAGSTSTTVQRLSTSVHQWAAVLEFQAVETFATDYRLSKPQITSKVRVANQFDLIALGVSCISLAINNSKLMDEDDSENSDLLPQLNSPAPNVSE